MRNTTKVKEIVTLKEKIDDLERQVRKIDWWILGHNPSDNQKLFDQKVNERNNLNQTIESLRIKRKTLIYGNKGQQAYMNEISIPRNINI